MKTLRKTLSDRQGQITKLSVDSSPTSDATPFTSASYRPSTARPSGSAHRVDANVEFSRL